MRKTGRHTFVIDGNYFLFRTLYVLPRKSKKAEMLGTDEDAIVFMRKLATDFAYQIRLFDGLIDKVVWTIDSRSWRKDFYPDAEYKGNRKQDTSINWERVNVMMQTPREGFEATISTLSEMIKVLMAKLNDMNQKTGKDKRYDYFDKELKPKDMMGDDRSYFK